MNSSMAPKKNLRIQLARMLATDWQLWVMLLPAIAVVFIFNYIPIYGIQLAFKDFHFLKGLTGGNWAGMKYFQQYWNNQMFWPTLYNTFIISFTSIVLGFPAPVIMALLFNQVRQARVKRILQTTAYMPYFISTVVMVSLIRQFLTPSTGVISIFMKNIGLIASDVNLLGEPDYFVMVYVLSGIWQGCGWGSIIYFAALSSVNTELYDAAKIDGANRLRIVWHIDIPALVPTMVILLILNMGGILNVGFEKVLLMQNDLNRAASEVISTYVYKIGLLSNQYSFGAAVGLFNTVINFIFLVATNFMSKRVSGIGLM